MINIIKSPAKSYFSQKQWNGLKNLIHKRDGKLCKCCQKHATDLLEEWSVTDESITLEGLSSACNECANKNRMQDYPFSFKKIIIPQRAWVESKFPASDTIKKIQAECDILKKEIQLQVENLAKNFSYEEQKQINNKVQLWFDIVFIEEDLENSLNKKCEFYAKISTLLEKRETIYINYDNANQFVHLINKEYDLFLLENI